MLRQRRVLGIGPESRNLPARLSVWRSDGVARRIETGSPCATIAAGVLKLRLAVVLKIVLTAGVAIHFRHHFHGPAIDYVGLAVAAAASWVGVPGPGEPVLIAAGVVAARHKLDISSVIVTAWAGAMVGGVIAWLTGRKAGRAVLTRPGPLLRFRRAALTRGDQVFMRAPVVAVFLAPAWMAGIHRARARVFLPTTVASAVLWAGGIGLGAYYVGPAVIDVVNDAGLVLGICLVLLVTVIVGWEALRRRRRWSSPG
jgi:membrane protein DedA with SNARE-associated domain